MFGEGGLMGMFNDPGFMRFLAQLGTGLDPEGAGGIIGRAAVDSIESQQAGNVAAKQDQRWSAILDALAKGSVSSATMTEGKNGTVFKVTGPGKGLGSLNENQQQALPPLSQSQVQNSPSPMVGEFLNQFSQTMAGMLSQLGVLK
jgi:hypothetical protein